MRIRTLLAAVATIVSLPLTDTSAAAATYLVEDFADNTAGWALDAEWGIGPAQASSGHSFGFPDPATDTSPTEDNGVAGVVIGGNASAVLHPSRYLTSPAIDTTGAGSEPLLLSFRRWLNSDYTPYMRNSVEVFDGTSWSEIWATGAAPGVADDSWGLQSFDISAYSNTQLRVRFGFSIGSSGVYSVSSWNLDDVRIGTEAPVGDPPDAQTDVYDAVEGTTLTVPAPGVLGNDVGAVSAELVQPPAGSLTLASDGSFTYSPPDAADPDDVFTYRACNEHGCDEAAVVLHIQFVNEPPVADADTYTILENETLAIPAPGVLGNDTDPDGDPLTAMLELGTSLGTIDLAPDGSFVYTPDPGRWGGDGAAYRVCDDEGGCAFGSISIEVLSVNDPPIAADDEATTPQYTSVRIDVLANDTDPDDPLRIDEVGTPAHGTVRILPSRILEYTPDPSFKGADAFTYTLEDNEGARATATVRITEDGCGEDGIDALPSAGDDAPVSGLIDRRIEPAVGERSPDAARRLHTLNCGTIVPVERTLE